MIKTDKENTIQAYYKVSYHISPAGEAHTIGESLIKINKRHCNVYVA
jgi:hypothetical protein